MTNMEIIEDEPIEQSANIPYELAKLAEWSLQSFPNFPVVPEANSVWLNMPSSIEPYRLPSVSVDTHVSLELNMPNLYHRDNFYLIWQLVRYFTTMSSLELATELTYWWSNANLWSMPLETAQRQILRQLYSLCIKHGLIDDGN